jgi:hypothetical protein
MASNGKKLRAAMKREPFRGSEPVPEHLQGLLDELEMEIGQQPDRTDPELIPGMTATT